MENQNTIDVKKLFRALNYYKLYIIGIAVIITAIYGLYVCVLQNQESGYKATSQIYVEEKPVQDNVVGGNADHAIKDYTSLVQSDLILKNVQSALKDKYTINQLRSKISATSKDGSNIINIKVVDSNPKVAKVISNQVANSVVNGIAEMSEYYNAYMVSNANESTVPIKSNTMINVVKVFVVLLVLACGVVACIYLVRGNIKDDEAIEKRLDTMILGSIPFKKNTEEFLAKDSGDIFKPLYVCVKDFRGSTLMITSPHSGDGKSLVSKGLAEQFIKNHKKTLLVTINKTNSDSEIHTMENGVEILNLDNGNDLEINSLTDRINQLKFEYETVLIDGGAFDTGNTYALLECCDRCVIVLDPHKTGTQTLANMKKRLDKFGCGLEGLVFNKVKF